jgi:hypothetical protein
LVLRVSKENPKNQQSLNKLKKNPQNYIKKNQAFKLLNKEGLQVTSKLHGLNLKKNNLLLKYHFTFLKKIDFISFP